MTKLLTEIIRKLKFWDKTSRDPDDIRNRGYNLLPVWFTGRMMDDVWGFGLLMDNGIMIGIHTINRIRQAADGSLWLDVRLMDHQFGVFRIHEWEEQGKGKFMKGIALDDHRQTATINASRIVAAFDIADS